MRSGSAARAAEHQWERTPPFAPTMVRGIRETAERAGAGPLVALDIDGTILGHDGGLSTQVRDAVGNLLERGANVVLSTGRSVPAVLPVLGWLGIRSGWAVCSNGAVTIRVDHSLPDGYEVSDVRTFDPGPAVRALVAEAPDVLVAVEDLAGRGFKVTAPFPAGELVAPTSVVSLAELVAEPVTRVTLRAPGRSSDHFADLVGRVGLHGVTYAVGWTAWLDLTPPGVSKASALEVVRARLGVPARATVAAGDGTNDHEMLAWAALGVAMGGADTATIALADAVTGHVADDGLVPVLRALA